MHVGKFLIFLLIMGIYSCEPKRAVHAVEKPDEKQLLDSIAKEADSVYSKPYNASGFTTAEYMVNSKDSTITQVMKDTAGNTLQVTIVKNKRRIYFAPYYPNGQLKASYAFDQYGQYNGAAEEYWENGLVKEAGYYKGGLREGEWKNYDSSGRLSGTVYYDKNGQPGSPKD
jgi:antitoxin component YwqK of YwqJK toxin-antitoxin module